MIGEVTERVQIPKYMLSKKFMFTPEMISTGDLKKKKIIPTMKKAGGGGIIWYLDLNEIHI